MIMKLKKRRVLKMMQNNFQKVMMFFSIFLFYTNAMPGQSFCYDNFEGHKSILYVDKSGVLDSFANNPSPDKIDSSEKCALYIRNAGKKFDNIKMLLSGKLTNVDSYAT